MHGPQQGFSVIELAVAVLILTLLLGSILVPLATQVEQRKVSDTRKALLLFEDHGTLVVESEVLLIEGDNKPGSLAKICHKLAEAKINIEYCYCATPPDARKGLLIMRLSDAKKALKTLNL